MIAIFNNLITFNLARILNTIARPKYLFILSIFFVSITYGLALYSSWPTLKFTNDGWCLYELSRSISSKDFYAFWCYRSYWSKEYSASFPLGFPCILWGLHQIFGEAPSVGVVFNFVIAGLTPLAAGLLAKSSFGNWTYGFIPGIALLLFENYMHEVVGAGTIPLTILISILGLNLLLSYGTFTKSAAAGFILGLAVLMRFDQLIFCALAGLFLGCRHRKFTQMFIFAVGALLAVSPWIAYSLTHFGTIWASDNSWVTLASSNAYVLDYPAQAKETIFTHPTQWTAKCLLNSIKTTKAIFWSAHSFPYLFILLGFLGFFGLGRYCKNLQRLDSPAILLPAMALLALLPQILTGYTEPRYFSMLFLLLSITLTAALHEEPSLTHHYPKWPFLIMILAIVISSLMAFKNTIHEFHARTSRLQESISDEIHLKALAKQHSSESDVIYIFPKDSFRPAVKYGAIFKRRSGMLPSNWQDLDEPTRQSFKDEFAPMKFIEWKKAD